jgi:hypothetical protein
MDFTVKGLIDRLVELGKETGKDAPVIFALQNRQFELGVRDIHEIEPDQLPGCGCWSGAIFGLWATPGLNANGQPLTLSDLLEHLRYLNAEIFCDAERISSHKIKGRVLFRVKNRDLHFSLELEDIAIQHAATLGQPHGIVFKLKAIDG